MIVTLSTFNTHNRKNATLPGWLAKPRLAARKETWREFSTREELLAWLAAERSRGLFVHHLCWPLFDFDAADGEQPLALLAARVLMQEAGLKEGRDYRLVLTGGKGVRVVSCYLLPSPEDTRFFRCYLFRLAEETYIPAPFPPAVVREAKKQLAELEREWEEAVGKLVDAAARENWAEARKIRLLKLAPLSRRIEALRQRAAAWDEKHKRVRISAFLDPAVGARPVPERILGWDEVRYKWGELLPPGAGAEVDSASDYKRLCAVPFTPAQMADRVLAAAEEILPREADPLPEPVLRILEAERRRDEILQHGGVARKDFSYLFALFDAEVRGILSSLQRIVFPSRESDDFERAAFAAAAAAWPLKEKPSGVWEVQGLCPACGGGDRRKDKSTAFIFRAGGKFFIKCHRQKCVGLNSPRRLRFFLIEKGFLEVEPLQKERKPTPRFRPGLGTYLNPRFRRLDSTEAAVFALSLLKREGRALISWPLGAGKTTFAALLASRTRGRVWALFPTWDLAEEFAGKLKNQGVEPFFVPAKREVCPYFGEVEDFRAREAADAHKCYFCPLHPRRKPVAPCSVIAFLSDPPKKGIIVGVHAHLHFALEAGGLVILDEAHRLLSKDEIPLAQLAQEIDAWLGGGIESAAGEELISLLDKLTAPALAKNEVLAEEPSEELKTLAQQFLFDLRLAFADSDGPAPLYYVRFRLEERAWEDARRETGEKAMPGLGVWHAWRALEALGVGKAKIRWKRKGRNVEGSLLFFDSPSVPSDFSGKLLLLSATAPPTLLARTLGLSSLPFRTFILPRKGRLVFFEPTSGTGKLRLKDGLPTAVRNALRLALSAGAEGIIAYKDLLPRLRGEFFALEEDAFVGWGRHEGINAFKDAKALAILGRPTPPPSEVIDWLLLSRNAGETLFWLFVSPLLQAIGRLRRLWDDEDATVFVIDRHAVQLERFLLPHLGPSDLSLPVTEQPRDTRRKAAALKAALATEKGKEEEVFTQVYLDLARQDGVSRQARWAWLGRFHRRRAFAARWQKWWEFVQKEAGNDKKPSFSALKEIFSAKIEEFWLESPRRGPPGQKTLLREGILQ